MSLSAALDVTVVASTPAPAWNLNTRVDSVTWAALAPYARTGDRFTGLNLGVPKAQYGYMIGTLATFQTAIANGVDWSKYAFVNQDAEYLEEATGAAKAARAAVEVPQIRQLADSLGLKYVMFTFPIVLNLQQGLYQYPDVVVTGAANWNASNMATLATPHVTRTRAAGRTPSLYVGDLKPSGTGSGWTRKTQAEVDADIGVIVNTLGVTVVSYFYEGQDTSLLRGALAKR